MIGWEWLTRYNYTRSFIVRVIAKAGLLFLLVNLIFWILQPLPIIGRISIYNILVPGRERLPYGESPEAYNLSLYNLDAMFASHNIARIKAPDEFRVAVIGDSAVWGVLLTNPSTLTGYLNRELLTFEGKKIVFYNLGYPTLSLTKDFIFLEFATRYQPDLILWLVTLESFPISDQLASPILQNNVSHLQRLHEEYGLDLDMNDARLVHPNIWDKTLLGQRRALADWWRLQLFGIGWSNTGIDQQIRGFEPRSNDFDQDTEWHTFTIDEPFIEADLAFSVLSASKKLPTQIPTIIINEPIYIADGANSDLHYNFWYPQWAYDRYRDMLQQQSEQNQWNYIDLWNQIPPERFTDSPVHMDEIGSQLLSEKVMIVLNNFLNELKDTN
ncbi:MAG: hypothetical protein J0L63_00080 [Anaerolineae bacterium]|nr:hypothetical protein [Anaerolineae bacterium]MBN8617266.1 hypothetical protein [Anaerolineae bacterium]